MRKRTMIAIVAAFLGLSASTVMAGNITLAVSSSISKARGTKGELLVRFSETGLQPYESISYEITGFDCEGAVDPVRFTLQADKRGNSGNSIYVSGTNTCAYNGMVFDDVTNDLEIQF